MERDLAKVVAEARAARTQWAQDWQRRRELDEWLTERRAELPREKDALQAGDEQCDVRLAA